MREAESTEIIVDRTELEDARWFSRAEGAAAADAPAPATGFRRRRRSPSRHHIIRAFVEAGEGCPLLTPLRARAPRILCAGIAVHDHVFRLRHFPQPGSKTRAQEFIVAVGGGCAANSGARGRAPRRQPSR